MTAEEMLIDMLQNGWEWTAGHQPGFVAIKNGTFAFYINPFPLKFQELLDARIMHAHALGKAGKQVYETL